jgi:hypothetical protein
MAAGLIDSSDVLVTKLGLKAGQNSQNYFIRTCSWNYKYRYSRVNFISCNKNS